MYYKNLRSVSHVSVKRFSNDYNNKISFKTSLINKSLTQELHYEIINHTARRFRLTKRDIVLNNFSHL